MITREDYAIAVCREMAWPVSKRNLWAMVAWQQAERSVLLPAGGAKWNPMNTTQRLPGSTDFNDLEGDIAVQSYVSFEQGVAAFAKTIRQDHRNYPRIRRSFAANNFAKWTLTAVKNSQWGTGQLALECLPFIKRYYPNYANKPLVQ